MCVYASDAFLGTRIDEKLQLGESEIKRFERARSGEYEPERSILYNYDRRVIRLLAVIISDLGR